MRKKDSLQKKIISLFCVLSLFPILVLSFFSYYNHSTLLKQNTEELTNTNLKQMDDNLNIWLESYEDLLYQVYTNDDVVAWTDNINQGHDVSVNRNQLRRYLRGLLNTKEYIRSITIITSEGAVITYEQLTSATYENSWLANFSLSQQQIFEQVAEDNSTHVFSTEFATNFANEDFYYFHIAHRIIDYRDLGKRNGVVIVSMDEEFLENVCHIPESVEAAEGNFNFLVDQSGRIISYREKERIGEQLYDGKAGEEERKQIYEAFVAEEIPGSMEYTSVYLYHDDGLQWELVNVTDQSEYMYQLKRQIIIFVLFSILLFGILMLLTKVLSRHLVTSVKKVVVTMQKARAGRLDTRIEVDGKMPLEIETIALQFNEMLEELEEALRKEKEANEKKVKAEIKALEAQINPHFLYNILDTINWMAIDRDEFDISNAINALAVILRYAINNSNGIVTVREEMEWLKKYIYLQQFRLKNSFVCKIEVEPEAMDCHIHKLLLLPFVENSIVHGFEGSREQCVLMVSIAKEEGGLGIIISDNGKGIEDTMVDSFNRGEFKEIEENNHIGMENAITRLFMYYGDHGDFKIESQVGKGTRITLKIIGSPS